MVIDKEIRSFLDSEGFMRSFPDAYARWCQAEQELWDVETPAQMTRIGHTCREALQEFAARSQNGTASNGSPQIMQRQFRELRLFWGNGN